MGLYKLIIIGFVMALLLLGLINFLAIKYNGEYVPAPDIPRNVEFLGTGTPLTYVVMGDSTAVGQGGDYENGIARSSAQLLAEQYKVSFYNFAISGARTEDVKREQLQKAVSLNPDIVLISAGANDVTHLTDIKSVMNDITEIFHKLRSVNPKIKIIITGSPAMGTVPRFAQPLRYIAKLRTNELNKAFERLNQEEDFIFAPIAARTSNIFSEKPELYAKDNFHPNNEGYRVWVPVINKSISIAIKK